MEHYAPFYPPEESITTAYNALKEKSLLIEVGNGAILADYTTPPGDIGPSEPGVFKKLENIMDVFEDENPVGRKRNFSYKDCPDAEVASDGTNFKIDAYITTPRRQTSSCPTPPPLLSSKLMMILRMWRM